MTVNQGGNNIAIGWAALEGQTAGSNIAIGHAVMNQNLTGTRNVAIGPLVMQLNTDGTDNVAIGQEALKNAVHPQQCVAIGAYALGQTNGTPINDTAVGQNSLLALTTGINNSALGVGSLNTLTTYDNCTGLGLTAQVTGSNQVQLGNASTTTYAYGAVQDRSDARDKADVRDTVLGLEFILALRPVDFRWDRRDEYRTEPPSPPQIERPNLPTPLPDDPYYEEKLAEFNDAMAPYEAAMAEYRAETQAWADANKLSNIEKDGSKKRTRYHHGLIAQEVQALVQSGAIEDFGGFQDHSVNGGDDVLSIGYNELIGPLIKAVQELNARLTAAEAAVGAA